MKFLLLVSALIGVTLAFPSKYTQLQLNDNPCDVCNTGVCAPSNRAHTCTCIRLRDSLEVTFYSKTTKAIINGHKH